MSPFVWSKGMAIIWGCCGVLAKKGNARWGKGECEVLARLKR